MDPPDRLEKGLRLGCGFLFGCLAGLWFAFHILPFESLYILCGCLAGAAFCAILALRFGDRFWMQLSRITRSGYWWW